MKWSTEKVEALEELHSQSLNDRQIAEELTERFDCTFTKDSVKNKRARLQVGTKQKSKKSSKDLYRILKRSVQPLKLDDILTKLNLDVKEFEGMVHELREDGYNISWIDTNVELIKQLKKGGKITIPVESLYNGKLYQFGILSDPHYGSKYARLDINEIAYNTFAKENITTVYMPGNILDGYLKRINHFDLLPGMQGYDAQVKYLIENYPQRDGITTYFLTGDCHEGWWAKDIGLNVGEHIQLKAEKEGRNDLIWIGHMEVDIELKNIHGSSMMRMVHPGGGSSYAVSYKTQKLVESYQGGEKPHILIVGHFHKMLLQYTRNVWVIQAGTTQDQSSWMRKHSLQAHVGFWIIRFHQAKTGEVNRLQGEFFPFFDKGFYTKKDAYKTW